MAVSKDEIAKALGTDIATLDAIFSATNSKRAILVNEQKGLESKKNAIRADLAKQSQQVEAQITELDASIAAIQAQIDSL